MFQFLIILIAIAIVAVAWVVIHFIGKALDKRAQRQAEKEKEEKAIFEAKVEEIKMRYLAEDKVVNLDEIEIIDVMDDEDAEILGYDTY